MSYRDDNPPEVCRYDLMALGEEAQEYASRWDSEQALMDNATPEEREYLLYLVSTAGEAVAQLLRANEPVPDKWKELREARNEASHSFDRRSYEEAWRLASELLPEVASELSRELPAIPGYDRKDTDRSRHFLP